MSNLLLKSFFVAIFTIILTVFAPTSLYASTYTELFSDSVENGSGQWTISGTSGDSSNSASLWHISSKRTTSPSQAWYYGRESTNSYDTGFRNWGAITSEPITIPSNIENPVLQFETFASTESDITSSLNDIGAVEMSNDGGVTWNRIATIKTTNGSWTTTFALLPSYYLASSIQIRFYFDTYNSFMNNFEGWYIDDVLVYGTTPDVEPQNNPPVANPGGPYSVSEDQSIWLDGSQSYDPDGDAITGYIWNFGDEGPNNSTFSNSPYINHIYAQEGTYTVTLQVQDQELLSEPISTTVTVIEVNDKPVANVNGPYTIQEGAELTLDASNSVDPDGDEIQRYIWTFGDSDTTIDITSPTVNHIYLKGGEYTVTLKVSDGELVSDVVTTTVTVVEVNDRPEAQAGTDQTGFTNELLVFDASESRDEEGIESYSWNMGNGEVRVGQSISYQYPSPGVYTVTLTVTDISGLQDTDTLAVSVANDEVTVTNATYYNSRKQLVIEATSSSNGSAVLTASGYGAMSHVTGGQYRIVLEDVARPGTVSVVSSYGGTDTSSVTKQAR